MSSGKKQFILFAIAAVLFSLLLLAGVAGNVAHGNYRAVPLVFIAIGLSVFLVWFSHWRVRLMLRDATPDRLITHYHATARRMSNPDAAAAYLSALAAAVFGQFERAREELSAVDWDKAPVMYQENRLHVLAVIALLEARNSAEALRLVTGHIGILPGAIRVAAGLDDTELLAQTEKAAGRSAGVIPAICAWALSRHFERLGASADAARFQAQALNAIPHFAGLDRTA